MHRDHFPGTGPQECAFLTPVLCVEPLLMNWVHNSVLGEHSTGVAWLDTATPGSGYLQTGSWAQGVIVVQSLNRVWLFFDSMDCIPLGSSVHGISQARILEWVAIAFSGDLPELGIEAASPTLAGGFFATEPSGKPEEITSKSGLNQMTSLP